MTLLRELTTADAPAVQRVYGSVAGRFAATTDPMGPAAAVAWTTYVLGQGRIRMPVRYSLAIDAGDGLIGLITLHRTTPDEAEIGYVLHRDARGRGYATGAVAEALTLAFTTLGVRSVRARHRPGNDASGRVLVRNGFMRTTSPDHYVRYVRRRERRLSG
ncbi:GNAT family N-acetyltransferase [Streptomyces sp. NPDC053048]|uniref:GNAT family N-acetyltransferase n=1 Tax=Streptomyces sp. NPDC053048 TaxID=3365694 RepID=UPI0037D6427D